MDTEISRFDKNSQEEIIVQLTNYKGHELVDIRAWIKPLENGETEKPTKKGICLSPNLLPELIDALQKADKVFQDNKAGVADDEQG